MPATEMTRHLQLVILKRVPEAFFGAHLLQQLAGQAFAPGLVLVWAPWWEGPWVWGHPIPALPC